MNLQLIEKIDGMFGISVLLLMFVALAASQAGAGVSMSEGALPGMATANAAEPANQPALAVASTDAAGEELTIRIDTSQAESIVEAVGNLIITAAVRDAD